MLTTGELAEGAQLAVPLFLGFAGHGLVIRFRLMRGFARPIDRGATFRGQRLFGENKTYRGVLCVAVGAALGFILVHPVALASQGIRRPMSLALLGMAVGAVAMLAELPNSMLKRQLRIPPGAQGKGWLGTTFQVLDQVDVLIGAWAVLAIVIQPTLGRVLGSALCVYVGHQVMTLLGYWLGMRATAR